jgi:hypothetical protein
MHKWERPLLGIASYQGNAAKRAISWRQRICRTNVGLASYTLRYRTVGALEQWRVTNSRSAIAPICYQHSKCLPSASWRNWRRLNERPVSATRLWPAYCRNIGKRRSLFDPLPPPRLTPCSPASRAASLPPHGRLWHLTGAARGVIFGVKIQCHWIWEDLQ